MTPAVASGSATVRPSGARPAPSREPVRIPRRIERSARTSEVVAASIRSQIARGELKAGDRFPPEDELMEVFGIARTTLREALRILESEGLVTVVRGRHGGPRVTTPSVEHMTRVFALLLQLEGTAMLDVCDALAVIEPPLAARFVENRTPEALAELKAAIDAAAEAAADEEGLAFGEASAAVHQAIMGNAGNVSLSILSRLLHAVIRQYYRRSGNTISATERRRAVRAYRKFYKLAEAGDVAAAEEHWRQLVSYPLTRIKRPVDLFS